MNFSRITGLVIVVIGLLSGLLLVARAFVAQIEVVPGAMLLLFLGCLSFGLPLFAGGTNRQAALRLSGSALLLVGLAALGGVFADSAGLLAATRETTLLWVVGPIGIVGGLLLTYFAGALDRLAGTAR